LTSAADRPGNLDQRTILVAITTTLLRGSRPRCGV